MHWKGMMRYTRCTSRSNWYCSYLFMFVQSVQICPLTQELQHKHFMSWYGSQIESTRQLDALLDTNPSLADLFSFPEFLEQLSRSYNPKLLAFLTNSNHIVSQALDYITVPPKDSDTDDRKYKLPLYTIEMIRTETVCILMNMLRIDPISQIPFICKGFFQLLSNTGQEVLPLLCGYFLRLNFTLFMMRPAETIDCIYSKPETLLMLVEHSYSPALCSMLHYYLLLDLNQHPSGHPQRLEVKMNVLASLIQKIKSQSQILKQQPNCEQAEIIVENISEFLLELIEKYFLIADGKAMLEYLLNDSNSDLFLTIILDQTNASVSVSSVVIFILRYYAESAMNIDEKDPEIAAKNQEKLQSQPLIRRICNFFGSAVQILLTTPNMRIRHSKLMSVLNTSMFLISRRIFEMVRETKYLQLLIEILFKYDRITIIQKQIERIFQRLLNTPFAIYEIYKQHITERVDFIQATFGRYITSVKDIEKFQTTAGKSHQGYFGHLMTTIKSYSEAYADKIYPFIMQKQPLLKSFFSNIANPYYQICLKKLGSYEGLIDPMPTEYNIRYIGVNQQRFSCKEIIDEVNLEELLQKPKQELKPKTDSTSEGETSADPLFDVSFVPNETPEEPKQIPIVEESKPIEEGEGFASFLEKKKVEVEKEIRQQRSSSKERTLSAQRTRVTSPSPKRKSKWEDNTQSGKQEEPKNPPARISFTRPRAVPLPNASPTTQNQQKNGLKGSPTKMVNINSPNPVTQERMSSSMLSLSQTSSTETSGVSTSRSMLVQSKNLKICVNVAKANRKECRKINASDSPFLKFLQKAP